jgi:hypothetical protein
LRCIWRDVQTVKVKICHLHTRVTDTILFRLRDELILIFHLQHSSRLNADQGRDVLISITKLGFARGRIGCRHQRHRGARFRQFRKDSVLPIDRSDKQSKASCRSKCVGCEMLQELHTRELALVPNIAMARARGFVMPPARGVTLPRSRQFYGDGPDENYLPNVYCEGAATTSGELALSGTEAAGTRRINTPSQSRP